MNFLEEINSPALLIISIQVPRLDRRLHERPQVKLALHSFGVDKIRTSLVLRSRQWGSATH